MREINKEEIIKTVKDMCIKSNITLPDDLTKMIKKKKNEEIEPLPLKVFNMMEENILFAQKENIPICQDTGMVDVLIEYGSEIIIKGDLKDAINEGVRQGYIEGNLRKSMVNDPLLRLNTKDNTPALIFTEIVEGDKLKITVAPKGAGSENMSDLKMMSPSSNEEDIINFVVGVVKKAGGRACPPVVVGVGIGGDFAYCPYLAKKALVRDLNNKNSNQIYANLEEKIEQKINETGIGPQGFGGKITTLKVNIETYPTHIAAFPIAVNLGCHVTRHITQII